MQKKHERSDFAAAERRLRLLLGGAGSEKNTVQAFQFLREHHEVPDRLPAKIRVNRTTLALSDLPRRGRHANQAVDVRVADCLDLEELDALPGRYGEVGSAARTILLDALHRYLRTRIAATDYAPWHQTVDGVRYTVHNDLVTLRPVWKQHELSSLLATLQRKGVFRLECPDERLGLARTSSTETNPDMLRQWTLDSCMLFPLQAELTPELWPRSLITNCGFHITDENQSAARRTVERPAWYREGDAKRGMAHIFLPAPTHYETDGLAWNDELRVPELRSFLQDPAWGNRQRLESQAILVHRACSTLGESFSPSRPRWALRWEEMTDMQIRYVIEAIQVTMPYLLAVQWDGKSFDFHAPTVSSWEEAPFPGGCASDTGFMIDAAKSLRRLLFGEEEKYREVAERLSAVSPSWERLLKRSPFADFRRPGLLDNYIQAGQRRLAEMVIRPIVTWAEKVSLFGIGSSVPSGIKQFDFREADTSLTVLAAHHERFSDNPLWDALVRFGLVRFAEAQLMNPRLGEPCGMWRYGEYWAGANGESDAVVFDSYLNLSFHHALLFPGLFAPWFGRTVKAEDELHRNQGFPVEVVTARRHVVRNAADRFSGNGTGSLQAKKDATSVRSMVERQHLSLPEWTAQWTIGPTASVMALAKAKRGIIDYLRKHGESAQLLAALRAVEASLVRMLNLSIATIVGKKDSKGKPVVRSDGTFMPARYNVMEAFQACLDVFGNIRMLPGDHTLPWSSSQLFQGIQLAAQAALEAETLGIR